MRKQEPESNVGGFAFGKMRLIWQATILRSVIHNSGRHRLEGFIRQSILRAHQRARNRGRVLQAGDCAVSTALRLKGRLTQEVSPICPERAVRTGLCGWHPCNRTRSVMRTQPARKGGMQTVADKGTRLEKARASSRHSPLLGTGASASQENGGKPVFWHKSRFFARRFVFLALLREENIGCSELARWPGTVQVSASNNCLGADAL